MSAIVMRSMLCTRWEIMGTVPVGVCEAGAGPVTRTAPAEARRTSEASARRACAPRARRRWRARPACRASRARRATHSASGPTRPAIGSPSGVIGRSPDQARTTPRGQPRARPRARARRSAAARRCPRRRRAGRRERRAEQRVPSGSGQISAHSPTTASPTSDSGTGSAARPSTAWSGQETSSTIHGTSSRSVRSSHPRPARTRHDGTQIGEPRPGGDARPRRPPRGPRRSAARRARPRPRGRACGSARPPPARPRRRRGWRARHRRSRRPRARRRRARRGRRHRTRRAARRRRARRSARPARRSRAPFARASASCDGVRASRSSSRGVQRKSTSSALVRRDRRAQHRRDGRLGLVQQRARVAPGRAGARAMPCSKSVTRTPRRASSHAIVVPGDPAADDRDFGSVHIASVPYMDRADPTPSPTTCARCGPRAACRSNELAAASGTGKGTLSRIESAQANPTVETLYALADALGVPFGSLLTETTRIEHVRAADLPRVSGAVEARLLTQAANASLVEALEIVFPRGPDAPLEPASAGRDRAPPADRGPPARGPDGRDRRSSTPATCCASPATSRTATRPSTAAGASDRADGLLSTIREDRARARIVPCFT